MVWPFSTALISIRASECERVVTIVLRQKRWLIVQVKDSYRSSAKSGKDEFIEVDEEEIGKITRKKQEIRATSKSVQ